MRVRLTSAPDGAVFVECSYREWAPILDEFKMSLPPEGRRWDGEIKRWVVGALYISPLLKFLSQHGAQVLDDRRRAQELLPRAAVPDDLQRAFDALHVTATAPLCVAEASFKALARSVHPDAGGTAESFRVVNDAIEVVRRYLNQQAEETSHAPKF